MRFFVPWLAVLAGCVFGGGPLVGYGHRGLFAGAEVSAGGQFIVPQAVLGFQSDRSLLYMRLDEAVDWTAAAQKSNATNSGYRGTFSPGARIGGGFGLSFDHDDVQPLGMFAMGASVGYAPAVTTDTNSCGDYATVGVVELQLRYVADWSVVLVPRVERGMRCVPYAIGD
jgi:hypothetical protein